MSEELELSTGNVYRDLGLADPDEALARADLMLDILEEIHRQGLDLEETLYRLQMEKQRYFELLGGRVKRFTQEELRGYLSRVQADWPPSPAPVPTRDSGEWLHLPGRVIAALRDWLADTIEPIAPTVGGFAPAYRGGSRDQVPTPQSRRSESTTPLEPPAIQGLADPRFVWLPTLVKQEEDGLSLVVQHRNLTGAADEEPPQVRVFIEREPTAVKSRDYITQSGRLELLLDGKLPAPEFDLAVSPSDTGELILHLKRA
jgi:predicted XRE-type DNA-binding protein